MVITDQIDKSKLPQHIAIIMDGNGRWAKLQGKNRVFGHKQGAKAVKEIVRAAGELEIKFLTLYAFSTENWNRPKFEVEALMTLLISAINEETQDLIKNNVKLLAIGDHEILPSKVKKKLYQAIDDTKNNTGLTLTLALSYSSKWEIIEAVKKIASQVKNNNLEIDEITAEIFDKNLSTSELPHPELLIRTSGEYRISNFLLWQLAYSELYFTEKLWPDFNKDELFKAIINYQQRERRFGKTSEQITH
ncbi:MAG: isoprenyl transferase [Bacteroidales bacterium]|nr:isoprenyl transferase [Bacteroidales bacterium]MBN2758378.1 isoprenyl transferase [Bacteroidales bacterium]